MNLSPAMQNLLVSMLDWKWSPDYNDVTFRALERRGLVRWCHSAKRECFTGIWKLTAKGQAIAKELVEAQASA